MSYNIQQTKLAFLQAINQMNQTMEHVIYNREEDVDYYQKDFNPQDKRYKDYLQGDLEWGELMFFLYHWNLVQFCANNDYEDDFDNYEEDDDDEEYDQETERENIEYHLEHYNGNNDPNFQIEKDGDGVAPFADAIQRNHVNRLILLFLNDSDTQIPMRLLIEPIQRGQIKILRVLFQHRCFKHMRDRVNFPGLLADILILGDPVLFKIVLAHFRPTLCRELMNRIMAELFPKSSNNNNIMPPLTL
ncbi:hypothetical protein CYY_002136 [Polysphondylium violaceum]|uniref:Uncharacterized protein n=1 Tax=Polysphondylium violaceum TaxID=133409 RepID=A0A8J4PZQ8_9MYCE|nr:hypothetical protein CYY_002136 [Polysphondylium violaceum]